MKSLAIVMLLAASAAATPTPTCTFEPPPATHTRPARAAKCQRAGAAVAKTVRSAIAKEYSPQHDQGKAEVTFPCDGLGKKIREIVLEQGGGHGGSLSMWRARRRADGSYDVRGIAYQGSSMVQRAAALPFKLASGVVTLPDLAKTRAALTAKVREVFPPPPPNTFGGMSFSSSSRDFHVLIRLVDDDGRVVERRYTGYASSGDQDTYLSLELAAETLAPITALAPASGMADADDRALFAERFNAAVPHFDDDFYWWVMERYVDLARHLGSAATIQGLLTRLHVAKPDRSKVDARANAVDAIAEITGWDARAGGISVEDAAAKYLAECRPR